MLTRKSVSDFLNDVASNSPAPGGGSAAALAGALGAALTSMVCNLTIGKKKFGGVEAEMKNVLRQAEGLRETFTSLIDQDTQAFDKVMEGYGLPRETEDQKALRAAVIQEATKEASLVPLEVMKHVIDSLALAKAAAEKGIPSSVSDAGVSALMLHAASESAALNVQINLSSIRDTEFVGWKSEEVITLLKTSRTMTDEILSFVRGKLKVNP